MSIFDIYSEKSSVESSLQFSNLTDRVFQTVF